MCSQDIARLDTTAWAYKGSMPCVIDCYTTWCGPCKRLAPIMEELAEQYCGRVCFYKTDIERDRLLGRVFGAASIPTIVYVPVDGQPIVTKGLMPKEQYVQIIESVLLHQGAAAETQPNQE
ncbi:MAG: thiol reductase thioredoxin [Paludibacteraceae bacterium]|nr:thiol reductase thioredoxin [Paludibacteraceae bacterium]